MNDQLHNFPARRRCRSGIAMILVLCAIGLATVLGAAIIATSSTQVQVKGNILSAAHAQYLADSGVNLGIYRLQHPETVMFQLNAEGFYPGETGISLGTDVAGSVDVSIINVGTSTYTVTATSHYGPNPNLRVTRSVTAKVYVNTLYSQARAAAFNGDFTLPSFMSVDGDVRCDGNLVFSPGASVSGSIAASGSNAPVFVSPPMLPLVAAPNLNNIDIWTTTGAAVPYYTYVDTDGTIKVGTPQVLPTVATGTITPDASNPKNVWYADSLVVLTNVSINGTIVMRDPTKQLTIMDNVHITAMENMPAVVSAGPIAFAANSDPKVLNIEGLCWLGSNITTDGGAAATNCSIAIDGALLCGASVHGVNGTFGGTINVTFNATKSTVPNFSTVGATPQSVKILRWGI